MYHDALMGATSSSVAISLCSFIGHVIHFPLEVPLVHGGVQPGGETRQPARGGAGGARPRADITGGGPWQVGARALVRLRGARRRREDAVG